MRNPTTRSGALALAAASLLVPAGAAAYAHANRYGGTTSHSTGSTTATGAYGGSMTHTAGQGTTATNAWGGSASHQAGSDSTQFTTSNRFRPGEASSVQELCGPAVAACDATSGSRGISRVHHQVSSGSASISP